jgi:hypothetical protein
MADVKESILEHAERQKFQTCSTLLKQVGCYRQLTDFLPCVLALGTAHAACGSPVLRGAMCSFTSGRGSCLHPCVLLQVAAVYGYELHLSLDGAACGPVPTPSTVRLRPLSGDLAAEGPKQQQNQTQEQPQKQGVKRPLQVRGHIPSPISS